MDLDRHKLVIHIIKQEEIIKIIKKGVYISFEGNEGSGKDTLIANIIPWLKKQSFPVFPIREPGGVAVSEEIRKTLTTFKGNINPKTELFLFSACRSQNEEEVVVPHLEQGDILLSNRTCDASSVYQGYAGGLGFNFVRNVNKLAVDLLPDFTLLLLVDVMVGLQRVKKQHRAESAIGQLDRIEAKDLAYHQKVLQGYKILARTDQRFITIDTTDLTQEEVFEQAKNIFLDKIIPLWKQRNP